MKQLLRRTFLFLLSAIWHPLWVQAQAGCTPIAGLVAQYSFNELSGTTAQDATGQLSPGIMHGGTWQPSGGWDGGGALALTGSSYLAIPLYWQPRAFTFSFWLKPTSLYNYSQITGATIGWNGFLFHSTNSGGLYVGTDVATRIERPYAQDVQVGVWQQFTFTFDNGTGAIYKNGQLLASQANMTLPAAWQGIELGAPSEALYDELRVYDRAVSAQEAQNLYHCPSAATYLPAANASANTDHNWTLERSFDGNGNVVAESKQFTDALGRPTQAQARNAATKQAFAAQTIYNTGGQPVLQTMAAPTNNQEFSYKEGFVTARGITYGPANFEQDRANSPDAVDATTPGTLGYYYSKQNAQEPLTPLTSYPYSLTESYEGPMGGVKRAAAPGDELRMGLGREAKGRDFPVRTEFDAYLRLRPTFVPGSPNVTLQYQGLKSVSVNADGRESIVVTNKDGQAIISCLSGSQYPALPVYGFISSEASNSYDANAPTYQDIHIPAAGAQDVKFTVGGSVRIVNLLTSDSYDYPVTSATTTVTPAAGCYTYSVAADETHVTLPPGFYRFISLSGTQWSYYEAHYGDFSYTYYDDAGRVIATVAPKGLPAPSKKVPSADGAVAYWSFGDGTGTVAADGSGNNLVGTLQNQPVWSKSSPAVANGSLLFNQASSYVLVGDPPALRMGTTMSVEAWVYPINNTNSVIINKEGEYQLVLTNNGTIGWSIQNSSAGWSLRSTNTYVPINQWSRIGLTYNNGNVIVYFNGTQIGGAYLGTGSITYRGSNFKIGGLGDATRDFKGAIAEVRVWNMEHPPVPDADPAPMDGVNFLTRNTYDTSGRLLATESNDEGRSEYVYARDGRIRFSQSALQRPVGRFSYSNYDEAGRVIESGEYTQATDARGVEFQSQLPADSFAAKQEAEAGDFHNSTATNHQTVQKAGATFVNYLVSPGDHLQFTIVAPKRGTYSLQIQYATGRDRQTLNLVINNGPASLLTFPTSGSWNTLATRTLPATLQQGTNYIDLRVTSSTTGFVDVDNLLVTSPAATLTHNQGVLSLLEDRTPTGGLDVSQCAQRNQVWYDLAFDGTAGSQGSDNQLNGRKQDFILGAVAKTKNDNVTTWYSYDELGRVTWVVQDFVGLGTTKTLDYTYDFSGNVLEVAYQKGQPDSFFHHYGYDAAQRLTTVYTSTDGVAKTLQAEYSYYLHGPLKRVQVAGNLQGIDYTYTLQGALKNINHVNQTLEPGHDSPKTNGTYKDLFALSLDYSSGDYRSRNIDVALPSSTGVPTRFDGTIQGASWRTPASANVQRMAYTYDEKSQLQNSTYGTLSIAGAFSQFMPSASNAFQEGGLTYDPNGNLLTLRRTGQTGAVTDNFSYVYKPATNQLKEVRRGSASGYTMLDYDYDELGQLTRQRDEQGQRYFSYDVTGKTTGLYLDAARTQPLVTFTYDDRGFRASKTAYPVGAATTTRTTYYVRDVAGNILATYYQAAAGSAPQRTEVPLYGASRLGTLTHLDDGTAAGTDDYRYELSDHLGDARVVFHRPTTDTGTETLEPGVPAQYAFQGADTYRYTSLNAHSPVNVALLDGRLNTPPTLRRVVSVLKGDTLTFTAWARTTGDFSAPSVVASPPAARVQPFLLLGAATAADEPATRLEDGRLVRSQTGAGRWLGRLAVGLSFALKSQPPPALAATAQAINGPYNAWIKYRVLDEQGRQVGAEQFAYLGGDNPTGWQPLRLGVRVQQGGSVELTATSAEASSYVMFDDLTVEQTGGLIVQEQHQYAYGAPLPGLSYTVGNKRYRYGYQGQYAEHDDETGFESFELRMYNSRVGRWLSYDPEGQFSSPYVGMGNNPVSGVDPNGGFSGTGPWRTVVNQSLQAAYPVARSGLSSGARIGAQAGSSALRAASAVSRQNGANVRTASLNPALPFMFSGLGTTAGSVSTAVPIVSGALAAGYVGWQLGPWVNQHFDGMVGSLTSGLEWIGIPRELVEGPAKPILQGRRPQGMLPGDKGTRALPGETVLRRYHPDRTIAQERWYAPDGTPVLDKDYGHDHTGVGDPHMHDWAYPQPRAPNKKRGEPRAPNPGE